MPIQPVIAISVGDPQGIGPEIVSAAVASNAARHAGRLRVYAPAGWKPNAGGDGGAGWAGVEIVAVPSARAPAALGTAPSAWAGAASFACVEAAIDAAKRPPGDPGRADAIVTAPIAKEAWHLAGVRFPGHTELLADRFASPRSAMLFVGPKLRVILVTIHVALAMVPGAVTEARVFEAIELGHRACVELGVTQPRIAICGLNPHAGEHGLFGEEDTRVIAPAIARAQRAGFRATGPWPGDTIFLAAARGEHDLVVAMYHDQGLIPVKLLDQRAAVNVTVGLAWQGRRVIRTSPAHGTAFDIAGTGRADPASMIAAIELAGRLARTSA